MKLLLRPQTGGGLAPSHAGATAPALRALVAFATKYVGGQNLIVTPVGDVRLIDTNWLIDQKTYPKQVESYGDFLDQLESLVADDDIAVAA